MSPKGDPKRRGLRFEEDITGSIREALPDRPVMRNPNIQGTKGWDAAFLAEGEFASVEMKDTSKEEFYLKSRVSNEERDWMDKVERHGGLSLFISRMKEAGKNVQYIVPWKNIRDEKKISPSVLRRNQAVSFGRLKGGNRYDLRGGIKRFLRGSIKKPKNDPESKKSKVSRPTPELTSKRPTKRMSRKFGDLPDVDISQIHPKKDAGLYAFVKSHKWTQIFKKYWGIDPRTDGMSESVAIEYKRWSFPFDENRASRETWEKLTEQWGKKFARDWNKKMKGGKKPRFKESKKPFGGLYNKGGVQYKTEWNESPEHINTVVKTIETLREHGFRAQSGNPIKNYGKGRRPRSPDIVTVQMVGGKKETIAVEVLSGHHRPSEYQKKYGSKYDRVICLKPHEIPSDLNDERKLKNTIWKKIKEGL